LSNTAGHRSSRSMVNMAPIEHQSVFDRDGYLVIPDFYRPVLMNDLDQRIRNHFAADPDFQHNSEFLDKAQTDVIPWFPQNEGVAAFDAFDKDARLNDLSESILGAGWSRVYCMVMYSKQGTTGQAWHQDCPPESPKVFNLNRLVYTSDISDEIGGQIVVVPGSHKRGQVPVGNPLGELENQVVLRPRQGTLVLLHGHTWHRVLPIKGAYRFSINSRSAPAGAPDDITDVCVYRNMRYQFSTAKVVQVRAGNE
jgi:ectoine hydroxylase